MRVGSAFPGKGFAGRVSLPSEQTRPAAAGVLPTAAHLGPVLELYQAESCPHSADVREAMTELGLSYVAHNPRLPGDEGEDVLNEQVHDELEAIGGEDQIPFLVDHERGETRYESDDIVDYLHERYGSRE
jgi:glutaredoxin